MIPDPLSDFEKLQYTWRGWILTGFFAVLVWARLISEKEVAPFWVLLIALGAAWRWYTGYYIGGHSNFLKMGSGELATYGPYTISRHPLYFANILTCTGLIFFANCLPHWGEVLLLVLICIHHTFLARSEEIFLLTTQGEAYRIYLGKTSRWLNVESIKNLVKLRLSGKVTNPLAIPLSEIWRRQGGNLGKTVMAVFILWILAQLHI
jgi:protein-S-isoprenylcysteine O-methyltransferase Ste14